MTPPFPVLRLARITRVLFASLLLAGAGALPAAPVFAAAPPPQAGLWIGPIHACRSTVAEVVSGRDEYDGRPNAAIRFREGWAGVLLRVTEARVGEVLPVRLDGRILSEPIVREPIAGGTILIAGFEADEVAAIQAAVRQPC